MSSWPEPVERVVGFLRSSGTEAVVEEFPEGTPTAQDAAKAVGCELRQIVKSLVFTCGASNVLVLVPGDRRADARKVAAAGGCEKARVAGPELVLEATGFEPGAVAPFPLRRIDRVFVDRSLLAARPGVDRSRLHAAHGGARARPTSSGSRAQNPSMRWKTPTAHVVNIRESAATRS